MDCEYLRQKPLHFCSRTYNLGPYFSGGGTWRPFIVADIDEERTHNRARMPAVRMVQEPIRLLLFSVAQQFDRSALVHMLSDIVFE